MSERLRHIGGHLRRHGIAYAALTVAFSFSPMPSMAADLVTTGEIANSAVTQPKLAADSVVGGKILNETVTGVDIKNGTVTTKDVLDGTITGVDVKDLSIGANDIEDGSIDGFHVAENTIDSYNVADGSLGGEDIADGSIGAVELAESAKGAKVIRYNLGSHDFNVSALQVQLPGSWNSQIVANSSWSATMRSSRGLLYVVPGLGDGGGTNYRILVEDGGYLSIDGLGDPGEFYSDIRVYRTVVTSSVDVP